MQLTNIARDVGEDARLGRLYLPRRWLREAGVDIAAWIANPTACDGIRSVIGTRSMLARSLGFRSCPFAVARLSSPLRSFMPKSAGRLNATGTTR
jgi:hypothetical protein